MSLVILTHALMEKQDFTDFELFCIRLHLIIVFIVDYSADCFLC